MSKLVAPIFFEPVYRDYLWGGNKIAERFGRDPTTVPSPPVAESWEVSDRAEGMSRTAEGETLAELIAEHGAALIGSEAERFPLLVKILDANKVLSVQVHPDDETAATCGGEAKTEMWYILDAEPGAAVYCGLQDGVDESTLRAAIAEGTAGSVEALLNKIEVHQGETVYVPGGRVHAIAAGCLILEVQQNSNTTYRLFDWGRGREEHVEQGMAVVRWDDENDITPEPLPLEVVESNEHLSADLLVDCAHFRVERYRGSASFTLGEPGRFEVLFIASGGAQVGPTEMRPGQSCLVPACLDEVQIGLEDAELLRVLGPR